MNELAKDRESVPCELGDERMQKDYGYIVRRDLGTRPEKGPGMDARV